jgi:hypothetical protein
VAGPDDVADVESDLHDPELSQRNDYLYSSDQNLTIRRQPWPAR